jgi:thiol:disulfide interchange protein DsbC
MPRAARLACLLAALAGGGALAVEATDPAGASGDAHAALKRTLETRFPDIQVQSINPTPLPGILEIVSNLDVAYTDASGDYVLVGTLVDTRTRENLTQKRQQSLQQVDFSTLPLEAAITVVKGAGTRRVVVFADPLCPFCRRLEQSLQSIDDVTVYTFVLPIEELHPGAGTTAQHIWCAPDPASAWLRWILAKEEPPATTCDSYPGAAIRALGDRLRVEGTPTMFFPDGSRLAGAPGAAALETEIAGRQRRAESSATTAAPAAQGTSG